MNDFQKYIRALVQINVNNNITIKKEKFINDSAIIGICSYYNYDKKHIENFYKFTLSMVKLDNHILINFSNFSIVKYSRFCMDLFNAIKLTYNENIEYLGNMYINYIEKQTLKYDEFINLVKILYSFKEKIMCKYFFVEKEDRILQIDELLNYQTGKYEKNVVAKNQNKVSVKEVNTYVIEDLGKLLYGMGMAKKKSNNCKDEYMLNELGKKFYKMISIKTTSKEKKITSRLISLKIMSKKMSIQKHEKYYRGVIRKINSNKLYKNIAYKHEGLFKYFFNEYKILIDYSYAKYGNKCKIRFCGDKTNKKCDYDGVVFSNHTKEFIQITTISHSNKEKEEKEKIINYGYGIFNIEKLDDARKRVLNLVKSAITKKNDKLKSKVSIKLLIEVNCFDGYFIEDISNKKDFSSIFNPLKNGAYKFEKIDLVVNGYLNDSRYIEPWVITIK